MYVTTGDAGIVCYWARLSDTDGAASSILANGTANGQTTVKIKKSDVAFETQGCEDWTRR